MPSPVAGSCYTVWRAGGSDDGYQYQLLMITSVNQTAKSETVTETERKRGHPDREHLADLGDGCDCAELWEHLTENRDD